MLRGYGSRFAGYRNRHSTQALGKQATPALTKAGQTGTMNSAVLRELLGLVSQSGLLPAAAAGDEVVEDVWIFAKVHGDYWRMPGGAPPIDDYMSLPVL